MEEGEGEIKLELERFNEKCEKVLCLEPISTLASLDAFLHSELTSSGINWEGSKRGTHTH